MHGLTPDNALPLVNALMTLRDESLGEIARHTQIQKTNLSVWLKGAPQILSEKRVLTLLDYLGVAAGKLRTDMVHQWTIRNDLDALKLVLTTLLNEEQRRYLRIYLGSSQSHLLQQFARCKQDESELVLDMQVESGWDTRCIVNRRTLGFGLVVPCDCVLPLREDRTHSGEPVSAILDRLDDLYQDRVLSLDGLAEELVPDYLYGQVLTPEQEAMLQLKDILYNNIKNQNNLRDIISLISSIPSVQG